MLFDSHVMDHKEEDFESRDGVAFVILCLCLDLDVFAIMKWLIGFTNYYCML